MRGVAQLLGLPNHCADSLSPRGFVQISRLSDRVSESLGSLNVGVSDRGRERGRHFSAKTRVTKG